MIFLLLQNISNIPFEDIFILIEWVQSFLNRKFCYKLNVDIVVSATMGISIFKKSLLTAAMALKKQNH